MGNGVLQGYSTNPSRPLENKVPVMPKSQSLDGLSGVRGSCTESFVLAQGASLPTPYGMYEQEIRLQRYYPATKGVNPSCLSL